MNPALLDHLDHLLRQGSSCWHELDIMNQLDRSEQAPFSKPDTMDSWALFRAHFWLYHHLYQLDLLWRQEGRGLVIQGPRIQTYNISAPGRQGGSESQHAGERNSPAQQDPLARYYLNLENLEAETPDSLDAMLSGFWRRMTSLEGMDEDSDWATLELPPGSPASDLRRQYRRLCQRHHPDRGGDVTVFQAVQAAYSRLRPLAAYS